MHSTPVAKRSYLSILRDPASDVWTRRFAVLRRPYLHLYENSHELIEIAVLNTSAVRVETSPEIEAMLGVGSPADQW
jgi:kinesin family protein 1